MKATHNTKAKYHPYLCWPLVTVYGGWHYDAKWLVAHCLRAVLLHYSVQQSLLSRQWQTDYSELCQSTSKSEQSSNEVCEIKCCFPCSKYLHLSCPSLLAWQPSLQDANQLPKPCSPSRFMKLHSIHMLLAFQPFFILTPKSSWPDQSLHECGSISIYSLRVIDNWISLNLSMLLQYTWVVNSKAVLFTIGHDGKNYHGECNGK